MLRVLILLLPLLLVPASVASHPGHGEPFVVVLGVAQDAGHPQAACRKTCCDRAWSDPAARHRVASLGIVDPHSGQRWMIDATPDLPDQLRALADVGPPTARDRVDGVFLTHAHMGHYSGLLHLGREAVGAAGVPVFAMPRMRTFLEKNGPWSQLVTLENIVIEPLDPATPITLTPSLTVQPIVVPHRDEFSETVGFVVRGPTSSVLWLPDIDKWETWDRRIEDLIASVDAAFLDGTFYADGEVGRPMAEIPHPFISESMARFAALPAAERSKIRFVHFNHTNPVLDPESAASKQVQEQGFKLARRGARVAL